MSTLVLKFINRLNISKSSSALTFRAALLFFAAFLASACCGDKGPEKIKIGVSIPTQREERWVRDVDRLRTEAKARNLDLLLQISDNDAARQLAQCENLMAQGVKVLIVAPHDATAAAVIVEKAHSRGIPVISYDRLIANSDVDLYISFDNFKVGEIQGKYITSLVPKGSYIVLAGAPTDNNATLFRNGAMKIIGPLVAKGDIKIVMDQPVRDWQPSEAMKLVENALTAAGNKIDAILAPNDGTASGAIQALAAQGLAGKVPVTGQDAELSAARRVVEGLQSMTVFKDTRDLATAAIEAAAKLAAGLKPVVNGAVNNGKIDVPATLLPSLAVDKANIRAVLIDSGYLAEDQIYVNKGGK